MKAIIIVFFVYYLSPATADYKPPIFQLDLDLPAEKRWVHIAEAYKEYVPFAKNITDNFIPKAARPFVIYLAKRLNTVLETDMAEEMIGIAEGSGLPIGEVVLLNLIYDITAFRRACTSIVAQDLSGRLWHGRNLDYFYQSLLKNLTIIVDFQSKNKTVFTAVTFPFSVGVMTGQRPGKYAISLDERNIGPWWYNLMMALFTHAKHPISFAMREALQNRDNFQDAIGWLSNVPLMSPSNLIVSGVNMGEGVVITRDRKKAGDIWFLEPYRGRWFLVETNYDHWEPTPKQDDRRSVAIKAMNQMGQKNIDGSSMLKVLSTSPVLNDLTIYTTIMSASQPNLIYNTLIRTESAIEMPM